MVCVSFNNSGLKSHRQENHHTAVNRIEWTWSVTWNGSLNVGADLPLAQDRDGGAENDGHEIAGHEIDGPSCRA